MPPLEEVTDDPCPPVLVDATDGGGGAPGVGEGELHSAAAPTTG